jgi:ketosteroid isomerase-like protein
MASPSAKSNVETVKGMYESFAEGDIDAVTATWDATIELREPEGIIGGGTLHGQEEILENLFANLATDWTDVSVVPERFVDGGDTVVALTTWAGTYIETGKSVEFRGAHVFDFEDEMIVRWTSYADTALFNAALEG